MKRERAKLRLGVLASGRGSNLQAIIDACASGQLLAEVAVVISDQPQAPALERAQRNHIPAILRKPADFNSREKFEAQLCQDLTAHRVDLVCLAGFMKIIGLMLLQAFPQRIVNIHPSLLPAFPGLHAQRQAFEYGVKLAGCTVHIVDEQADHGPILRQAAVEVHENDTAESLAERILLEEHRLYPEAIQLFVDNRIRFEGRKARITP